MVVVVVGDGGDDEQRETNSQPEMSRRGYHP